MGNNRQNTKSLSKHLRWVAVLQLLLIALITSACATDGADTDADIPAIEGPAFVLFFTDP